MKVNKKIVSMLLAGGIALSNVPYNVFADSANVVTIGANLTEEQREKIFDFFGTSKDEAIVIEVTNEDERKYLSGIMSEAQIGKKTYSCSYVEPTESGGINVKTANLTYVTSAIIASTLVTSGVENANVLASAPIPVSGSGALCGIMMAYEQSSGEQLDEDKKELATEELVTTGDLSEEIGQDKATGIINDIKTEIIKNNTKDTTQIAETINNVTNNYNVTLNVGQIEAIQGLMEKIAKQDYNYDAIKGTLDTVTENVDKGLEAAGESIKRGTFFENLFSGIKDFFGNMFNSSEETEKDLGILANTNDEALGNSAKIDATDESVVDVEAIKEEAKGFFEKIVDWFKGLFGGNTELNENVETPVVGEVEDNTTAEEELILEDIEDGNTVEGEVTDLSDENNTDTEVKDEVIDLYGENNTDTEEDTTSSNDVSLEESVSNETGKVE